MHPFLYGLVCQQAEETNLISYGLVCQQAQETNLIELPTERNQYLEINFPIEEKTKSF